MTLKLYNFVLSQSQLGILCLKIEISQLKKGVDISAESPRVRSDGAFIQRFQLVIPLIRQRGHVPALSRDQRVHRTHGSISEMTLQTPQILLKLECKAIYCEVDSVVAQMTANFNLLLILT